MFEVTSMLIGQRGLSLIYFTLFLGFADSRCKRREGEDNCCSCRWGVCRTAALSRMWSQNFPWRRSLGTIYLSEQYSTAGPDSEQPQTQSHFPSLPSRSFIGNEALGLPYIYLLFLDVWLDYTAALQGKHFNRMKQDNIYFRVRCGEYDAWGDAFCFLLVLRCS